MRGPHVSAMVPEAMKQLQLEVAEKEKNDQVRVIKWDDIKDNLPKELKVSPIAMIPHKSRMFRAILDLSFGIRLEDGEQVPSVNESSIKTAPRGAINQLGQSLDRVIHAMAQAEQDAKVFMAKWDIKDGFWRLVGRKGVRRVELRLRPPPRRGQAYQARYPHITSNGLDRITTVFLCSVRDWPRRRTTIC